MFIVYWKSFRDIFVFIVPAERKIYRLNTISHLFLGGGSPQDAWNKHPERRDMVQTPITSICCRLAAVNLSCCAFRLVDNHVQCCSVGRPTLYNKSK